MAKSKQNSHEYYANYETCRNRLFDTFDPDDIQNEDVHLSYRNALVDSIEKGKNGKGKHGKNQ